MPKPSHRYSLFSQTLDRAAFVAYFLGAVVPLLGLAWITHRYALPSLGDGLWGHALVAAVLSTGALSLGSFLLLRRVTRSSLRRIDLDNQRLATLLEASRALAEARHGDEVVAAAAGRALALTGAAASYVLMATEEKDRFAVRAQAGDAAEPLYRRLEPMLEEMAVLSRLEGRPVLRGDGAPSTPVRSGAHAAAVPLLCGVTQGALLVAQAESGERFETAQLGSLATLGTLAAVALHNAELREAQQNFFVHVTDTLVSALDAHMDLQTGHSRRVAQLANRLARELDYDDARLQRLHFAALLHDIGMLKISPEMRDSKQACRQHPALGFRMLKRIKVWEDIAPFVLHHHEWYDGNGYPKGLQGEEIPQESRIIGLAEAFDSMIHRATYKPAVSPVEALRRIEAGSGTQFDPDLAPRFVALVRAGEIQSG